MKTSDKIILFLAKSKDWTKSKLADELGVSRPTLDSKLKDNMFLVGDIIKMQRIGIL